MSQNYGSKIDSLKQQFGALVDEFKQSYVAFHKNPDIEMYAQKYNDDRTELGNLSGKLFGITAAISSDMAELGNSVKDINQSVKIEKRLYGTMGAVDRQIEDSQLGAEQLYKDSQWRFNDRWQQNWEIFAGFVVICWIIWVAFNSKSIVSTIATIIPKQVMPPLSPGGRSQVRKFM